MVSPLLYILILEHNIKVFVVVSLVFGGKHYDVFSTFTSIFMYCNRHSIVQD